MADNDSNSGVMWFIGGAVLGVAAALLLAPGSGEETRRKIVGQAAKGKKILSDSSQEVIEKSRELYERGRDLAEEAADLFEKGRGVAEKKIDEAY